MAWQGQQPPAFNPAYNTQYNQPQGSNPSAPPTQTAPPYNPYQQTPPRGYQQTPPGGYQQTPPGGYQQTPPGGYQQTPPGGYSGAPTGYGGAPTGYGGAQAGGYPGHPPTGYGAPGYGTGAPPGADPNLWAWFQAVNVSRNGSIKAEELQQALLNSNWSTFKRETCETMIRTFDQKRDGTINFHEFAALWKYIQDWNRCFQQFDADRSGNIDANELGNAFRTFGYVLSPQFCVMIVRKFDRDNRNTINFDDFIQVCVMLKGLSEAFKNKDTNRTGTINIHYEQFLEMVLENAIH
ncbi:sorcin-like isoform X2 [Apostichopus japonicus]|uniref:sorcin-like isoform X2 n=1 Tax=Stichopus japonicus TaxID=307972 RepID=UPI003AB45AED